MVKAKQKRVFRVSSEMPQLKVKSEDVAAWVQNPCFPAFRQQVASRIDAAMDGMFEDNQYTMNVSKGLVIGLSFLYEPEDTLRRLLIETEVEAKQARELERILRDLQKLMEKTEEKN